MITTPSRPKNNNNGSSQQQQSNRNSTKTKKKEDGGSGNGAKKQRVFINKSNQQQQQPQKHASMYGSPGVSRPPPLLGTVHHQPPAAVASAPINGKGFGPLVPDVVMEDMLFRFLYNIPENEKENQIRVCFHIELAHWFFLDFYCTADNNETPDRFRDLIPCQKVGFAQFVRQVFHKCHYTEKWRTRADKIISEFHYYKSHVPTYGVIMLDPTLNYLLLVQGYYASKNSWGFPKGKINEDEIPMGCALREAYEEVGFDASDNVKDPEKYRPLQSFFGETLVRLFLATDVPIDFPFKPHLRKEIRKIGWFSIRDLPKYPKDNEGCARLGQEFTANCFHSVIPFMKGICDFIEKERRERNKPKCTILKSEAGSESSAFQPVIPRASSQQTLTILSPNPSSTQQKIATDAAEASTSTARKSTVENLFKPLKPDPATQPTSFTGQSFLEHIGAAKTNAELQSHHHVSGATSIPTNPAGVIGGESQYRRSKEIKHPKPLRSYGPVVVVYDAPQEQSSPENVTIAQQQQQPKETTTTTVIATTTTNVANKDSHEIVDMLRSFIKQTPPSTSSASDQPSVVPDKNVADVRKKHSAASSKGQRNQEVKPSSSNNQSNKAEEDKEKRMSDALKQLLNVGPQQRTEVRKCEAWKKFTLDRTRLLPA